MAAGPPLVDLQHLIESKQSELADRRAAVAAELEQIDAELAGAGTNRSATLPRRDPGRPPKSARGPGRPPKLGRPKGKRGRPSRGAGRSELHDRIRAALKGLAEMKDVKKPERGLHVLSK